MRSILLVCLCFCVFSVSCVSTKPWYNPKHVLWLEEMSKLDACETYEQFQTAAAGLGFLPRADEKKNDVRIVTYTRDVYVPKTKRTSTQALSYWINMYIPRVAFATPHTIYPFYNRDFKVAAEKAGFSLSSAGSDEHNYSMFRTKDQAKFTMTETYNAQNGISTYTVMF